MDEAGLRVGRGCRCLSPHHVPLSPWLASPSVSLAVPSPSSVLGGGGGDGSADIGRGRERSSPVVVGVSDSGTTRLLPSYRRRFFLSMESSRRRLPRSRTHASRLRSTTHARYREEKRNELPAGHPVPWEAPCLDAIRSRSWTKNSAARLRHASME